MANSIAAWKTKIDRFCINSVMYYYIDLCLFMQRFQLFASIFQSALLYFYHTLLLMKAFIIGSETHTAGSF